MSESLDRFAVDGKDYQWIGCAKNADDAINLMAM